MAEGREDLQVLAWYANMSWLLLSTIGLPLPALVLQKSKQHSVFVATKWQNFKQHSLIAATKQVPLHLQTSC